jgi:hypothetical protein
MNCSEDGKAVAFLLALNLAGPVGVPPLPAYPTGPPVVYDPTQRPEQVLSVNPLVFLRTALASHQIVFLGDIHPLAEPKQLVVSLLRSQQEASAIDLLALEVASEQQEWIDRYLESDPEDTSILLEHPRTLRTHWGISAEYLEIYRSVYRWNAAHPAHPIRILAADLLGWPIAPQTPQMATGGFVSRDQWMAASFRETLEDHPDWRVLIFMGGYHGLKEIGGQVAIGRVHDRFDRWFAGYLHDEGQEIYSILTDARQASGHPATRMFYRLASMSQGNFAVALDSTTDTVREPLYDLEQGGFQLEFWPARFPLRRAVDAMVILNRTTPITLLSSPPE